MDRSLGFGSTPSDWTPYSDSISLRLPYSVNLATECKSLTHYTKGTQSPLRAPTFCKHAVSGSISLRSEEHTSELQSQSNLVCRLLLEKKKKKMNHVIYSNIEN